MAVNPSEIRPVDVERPAVPARVWNLGLAAITAAPLLLARHLTPSATGVGTHQQLGLPPCTFLWLTGFPCPFCGMTTSWSHAAHLQLIRSFLTQPMGLVLFLVTLATCVTALGCAATGSAAIRPDRVLPKIPIAIWWTALVMLLAAWIYKSMLVQGWIVV